MKKFIFTLMLVLSSFVAIQAQETYVGVQYTRSNPDIRQPNFRFDSVNDSVGLVASVTKYETKNIGLTAEGSANFNLGNKTSQLYTGLAGLIYKARSGKKLRPFGKAVAGLLVTRADNELENNSRTEKSVGFKVSAGADYKNWRILEVGYLQGDFVNRRQNYVTLSTGFTFGK